MMNDRELLEKAADAAGVSWESFSEEPEGDFKPFHKPHWGLWMSPGWWNPLVDDGDAFRLMVDANRYGKHNLNDYLGQENDLCGGDYRKAMRRAIVRAAADMADS